MSEYYRRKEYYLLCVSDRTIPYIYPPAVSLIHRDLEAAGFSISYISTSGSIYYSSPFGRKIRLSDHDPSKARRSHWVAATTIRYDRPGSHKRARKIIAEERRRNRR